MVEKQDLIVVSYMLGIVSIVLAFFQPVAALIFGIIGFRQSRKSAAPFAKRAKKYNTIGIILGIIMIIVSIAISAYLYATQGTGYLSGFPTA